MADEFEPARCCAVCGRTFRYPTAERRRVCVACKNLGAGFTDQATAWKARAVCYGLAETFDAAGGLAETFDAAAKGDPTALHDARQVCQGCPVSTECLQFALDHDQWGVFGGTTTEQRRDMRRKASAA